MKEIKLPHYLSDAKPNPSSNRAPWYKNTAPAYAGIVLWFAFWDNIVSANSLAYGIILPIAAIFVAALLSHFLFYLVPALTGMKSGFTLAVLGSSVFGTKGALALPGGFMGILQFGWLAVNSYTAAELLKTAVPIPAELIMVLWGAAATFVGIKGVGFVGKISAYFPLIPLAILVLLLAATLGTVGNFDPKNFGDTIFAGEQKMSAAAIFSAIITAIVGFFATAGAAGADFGTNSRNRSDVQFGGLVGVSLGMFLTCSASVLIIAGACGNPEIAGRLAENAKPTTIMGMIWGTDTAKVAMFLLALAAFPSACFSSLIAANSFKSIFPRTNPTLSVSIGGAIAILLAVSGIAGDAASVFGFFGISFGPICGAMFADYFMSHCKWSGPRAGFNPAGWLAWIVGFAVGALPNFGIAIPVAPVCAFFVGATVYLIAMSAGLKTETVSMMSDSKK